MQWNTMKSVSSGPVTNHFSPLRIHSPVAPSRTAVASRFRASEPALFRLAVHEDVVAARHVRPEPARDLPELLVDEDLLEHRPALPADLGRHRSAVEVRGDRGPPDVVAPLARYAPAGPLELQLSGLQHLAHEPARPIPKRELARGEGQVHGH